MHPTRGKRTHKHLRASLNSMLSQGGNGILYTSSVDARAETAPNPRGAPAQGALTARASPLIQYKIYTQRVRAQLCRSSKGHTMRDARPHGEETSSYAHTSQGLTADRCNWLTALQLADRLQLADPLCNWLTAATRAAAGKGVGGERCSSADAEGSGGKEGDLQLQSSHEAEGGVSEDVQA